MNFGHCAFFDITFTFYIEFANFALNLVRIGLIRKKW